MSLDRQRLLQITAGAAVLMAVVAVPLLVLAPRSFVERTVKNGLREPDDAQVRIEETVRRGGVTVVCGDVDLGEGGYYQGEWPFLVAYRGTPPWAELLFRAAVESQDFNGMRLGEGSAADTIGDVCGDPEIMTNFINIWANDQ